MDFKTEYNKRIDYIDTFIESYIDSLKVISSVLKDGMKYAVLNGGKRLRSILCTELCYAFSGSKERALPFAAAIEFIHAYSLVHDDLPAMDNADLRRGLPSCHKKFGEDIAILIGDALLNTAHELMLEYCDDSTAVSATKTISSAAGIYGMVNGQMLDLAMLGKKAITDSDLIEMIEQKTMALIRGSAVSGAILSECKREEIDIVDKYAYHLGLAFQIRDDFEDYSDDCKNDHLCPNFINILGYENAEVKLHAQIKECCKYLSMIRNNEFLIGLNQFLFPEV